MAVACWSAEHARCRAPSNEAVSSPDNISADVSPPHRRRLRIPPGWHIEYNEWYEGDIPSPELQQDLLLAIHAQRDRILDVSWYYGDRDTACYRVTVWAGADPGPMLHVAQHESASATVEAVEHLLEAISAGRL